MTSPDFDSSSSVCFQTALLFTVRSQFVQIQQSKPLKHGKAGNQVKALGGFALSVHSTPPVVSIQPLRSCPTCILLDPECSTCFYRWIDVCDYCTHNSLEVSYCSGTFRDPLLCAQRMVIVSKPQEPGTGMCVGPGQGEAPCSLCGRSEASLLGFSAALSVHRGFLLGSNPPGPSPDILTGDFPRKRLWQLLWRQNALIRLLEKELNEGKTTNRKVCTVQERTRKKQSPT